MSFGVNSVNEPFPVQNNAIMFVVFGLIFEFSYPRRTLVSLHGALISQLRQKAIFREFNSPREHDNFGSKTN